MMRIEKVAVLVFCIAAAVVGQTLVATVPIGKLPFDIGVNPTTNFVYVSNIGPPASVSVVNAATDTLAATIPLTSSPRGLGVNRTTNQIFVGVCCPAALVVIDGTTHTITGEYPIPGAPAYVNDVESNHVTNKVYVGGPAVYVFDPALNLFTATVPAAVFGIAVDEINNRIYGAAGYVKEIDGVSNTVIRTIPTEAAITRLDVNPYTRRIIATDDNSGFCPYFDLDTGDLAGALHLGVPQGVSFNRTLNRFYTTGGPTVSADGDTLEWIEISPGFSARMDVGVNENTGRIYGHIRDAENNGTLMVYQENLDLVPTALTAGSSLTPPCSGPGGNPNCPKYNVTLTATVANTGSLPSTASAVRFAYSSDGGATFTPISGVAPVGGIARGGTTTVAKSWMMVAAGSYQIRVTVDANDSNVESDESNNSMIFAVVVP